MPKQLEIQFTQINNKNGILTKSFYKNGDELIMSPDPIFYNNGTCVRKRIEFSDLPRYIQSLSPFQSITLGIVDNQAKEETINIIPKNETSINKSVSRTKNNFKFPEVNTLYVFELQEIQNGPEIEVLFDKFSEMVNLDGKAVVIVQSNSTGIYDRTDNKVIHNTKKYHIYVIIKNTENIPKYIEILKKRAWLLGLGYIEVSKYGKQYIKNYLFDDSVFSPERLNYIASAKCSEPIYQNRMITHQDGKAIGLSITDINNSELKIKENNKYNKLIKQAKKEAREQAKTNKEKWVSDMLDDEKNTLTYDQLCDKINFKICQDDILELDMLGPVKVSEIFKNPESYHLATLSDPLDPNDSKGKAKLYTLNLNSPNGEPIPLHPFIINSFLHNGQKYRVYNGVMTKNEAVRILNDSTIDKIDPRAINARKVLEDEESHNKIINNTLEKSKELIIKRSMNDDVINVFVDPEWNDHEIKKQIDLELSNNPNSQIFRNDKTPLIMDVNRTGNLYTSELTLSELCDIINLYKPDKNFQNYTDMYMTDRLAKSVLILRQSKIRQLTKIINNPFVDRNFKIIYKQKYIPNLQIYQDPKQSDVKYDINGWTLDRAKSSLNWLCSEFLAGFHFISNLDMLGAIGALLTGIQIQILNRAPGFLFTSSDRGTGKSTLTGMISALLLNTGTPSVYEYSNSRGEFKKYIHAPLRDTVPVISFDNVATDTTISLELLMTMLTEPVITLRKLGANINVVLDTKILCLFNGVNINTNTDFQTRILPINLGLRSSTDPDPHNIINKIQWALKNRNKIICCILDIIKAGENYDPKFKHSTRFPEWDRYVRNPIHQLTNIDIKTAIDSNYVKYNNDSLYTFASELFKKFGNEYESSSNIIKSCFANPERTILTPLGDAVHDLTNINCHELTSPALTRCLNKHIVKPLKNFKLETNNRNPNRQSSSNKFHCRSVCTNKKIN